MRTFLGQEDTIIFSPGFQPSFKTLLSESRKSIKSNLRPTRNFVHGQNYLERIDCRYEKCGETLLSVFLIDQRDI
jgi:hypothetical protein